MDYFWNLKKFSLINNKESKFNRNFATAVRTLTKSDTTSGTFFFNYADNVQTGFQHSLIRSLL